MVWEKAWRIGYVSYKRLTSMKDFIEYLARPPTPLQRPHRELLTIRLYLSIHRARQLGSFSGSFLPCESLRESNNRSKLTTIAPPRRQVSSNSTRRHRATTAPFYSNPSSHVAEKAGYKLYISKKKRKVVKAYLSVCFEQIDALLATKRMALKSDFSRT